jgi:hypothetical protein
MILYVNSMDFMGIISANSMGYGVRLHSIVGEKKN